MENGANMFANESLLSAPTDPFRCISLWKVDRNGNNVEQVESTAANCETFKTLLEERRDSILFAVFLGVVTVLVRKRFRNQEEASPSSQTKLKMRTPLHWNEVVISVIRAYSRLGKWTDGNHHFLCFVLEYLSPIV